MKYLNSYKLFESDSNLEDIQWIKDTLLELTDIGYNVNIRTYPVYGVSYPGLSITIDGKLLPIDIGEYLLTIHSYLSQKGYFGFKYYDNEYSQSTHRVEVKASLKGIDTIKDLPNFVDALKGFTDKAPFDSVCVNYYKPKKELSNIKESWFTKDILFESYPPSQFEIQAERKFRKILPDLEDILLEVLDLRVQYDISKLISEGAFELYIDIMRIKTQEQKNAVSEAVSRIKDYLDDSGIEFSSAEIHQIIETTRDLRFGLPEPSRGAKREIFYVYDINEVIDLVNSTGEIGLNLQWFWNNERDWKE